MSTSPKIYLLKNAEGKFVSFEKEGAHFVAKLSYARYVKKEADALKVKSGYEEVLGEELFIHQSTEDEFMLELNLTTTQAVLSGELYKQYLETINYNLPTISSVNKNLKNSLNNSIDMLRHTNSMFREFEKQQEEEVFEVYAYYHEMILELSKVSIYEVNEVTQMLKTREIDRDSIMGICKKVLKNNKKSNHEKPIK